VAYIVREAYYFGFSSLQTVILALFVAGLCVALIRFRREPLERQPPTLVAVPFRFCGRYSLEIYGISVLLSHIIAYALPR
jgi:hypothetical protein